MPAEWDGNWTAHVVRLQPHFVDRFFPFDAGWYQRIATDGYGWDPSRPGLQQDIAFFPLWPAILRLAARCTPSAVAARCVAVVLSAALAFASVCAFHRLARESLSARAAGTATWLYALYPAASFLLLSYPVGLMNLLCILSLLAVLRGRFWSAASYAGLATASGPLGLGTAMAVWLCAAARPIGSMRSIARLLGLGLLAISGLAAFMLWQFFVLGDGLAFIKAQDAWAIQLPWLARIPGALWQLLIVPDFGAGLAYVMHALHARTLVGAQAGLEKGVQMAALGVALSMCLLCWRFAPRVVKYQGLFTLVLFVWFHGTSRPGNSTLRLTYCAMTTFLGLAYLLDNRQRLARSVIFVSAAMLFSGAFLTALGYHIV